MAASEPPEILYRYYTINRAEPVLRHAEVFFPCAADFNDPFDCSFRWDFRASLLKRQRYARDLLRERAPNMAKNDLKKLSRLGARIESYSKAGESFKSRLVQRVGLLSMSAKRDNMLMWSHYADKHFGVCVGFWHSVLIENQTVPLPVIYSTEYPVLSFFEVVDFIGGNLSDPEVLAANRKIVERIYLTKSKIDWEYESEWRIVDVRRGRGNHYFPKEAIGEVIYGCRTPLDQKNMVKSWIRESGLQLKEYEARQGVNTFRLDITEP